MVLYALHDGLVKPMPGNALAPSLAESWSRVEGRPRYEFVLRQGAKFHNGEPVTAEDVKFSFERYRGAAAKLSRRRSPRSRSSDARRVRFRLKQPWPDFMTYYGSLATGAGWVVPKKYVEKVGDDGFKKAPIGAGPYRFVSFNPGIELVLEAYEQYWRKTPSVKRLVLKAVPRRGHAAGELKRGEADIVYLLQGELAEEVKRTPGLTLKPTPIVSTHWLVFLDQWDPKSPWARPARAPGRQSRDQPPGRSTRRSPWDSRGSPGASFPRASTSSGSRPPIAYDPRAAPSSSWPRPGYPNGFDAGDLWCDAATTTMSEAVISYLQAVGIRAEAPAARARGLLQGVRREEAEEPRLQPAAAPSGTRPRAWRSFVAAGGPYVYGSYPDIDGLFREQAGELDRKRREATLHRIQQLIHDKAMYAPIWELGFIHASVLEWRRQGLGLIPGWAFSAPYEDVKLKGK